MLYYIWRWIYKVGNSPWFCSVTIPEGLTPVNRVCQLTMRYQWFLPPVESPDIWVYSTNTKQDSCTIVGILYFSIYPLGWKFLSFLCAAEISFLYFSQPLSGHQSLLFCPEGKMLCWWSGERLLIHHVSAKALYPSENYPKHLIWFWGHFSTLL